MAWDSLTERIEVAKRKIRDTQGKIDRCHSLPLTEGLSNQLMNLARKLESERLTLEKLEHKKRK